MTDRDLTPVPYRPNLEEELAVYEKMLGRSLRADHQTLCATLDRYWDAYNNGGVECEAINAEYTALQKETEARWPNAHCSQVDPALWDHFSDFHKDYYGFRPRGEMTAAEVRRAVEGLQEAVKANGWPDEK